MNNGITDVEESCSPTLRSFIYIIYICKPSLCNLKKEEQQLVVLFCVCVVYINILTEPAAVYCFTLCGVPFVASTY